MGFERFHQRIEQKTRDRGAAPVLIVALGDSVTQGIGGVDEIYHDKVYHAVLKQMLEKAHPLCTFSVINAGVDGNRVGDGLARLDRDVIRHQPDLVIIGFGLNDAALGGPDGRRDFRSALERLCLRLQTETTADILLLTPNMMLTRDNDAIPGRWRHLTQDFLHLQVSGLLGAYSRTISDIGQAMQIPVADVHADWIRLAGEGVDTSAMLSNGLNHPNPEGHRMTAERIFSLLWKQGKT